MSRYLTVSKADQQFRDLLTGRFSKSEFAQPVRNLNVNSENETVTFKIIDIESTSLIGALTQWYSLSRNIYLTFPILGGLAFLMSQYGMPSLALVLSSFFSLQFFLLSITLYNDYSDYLNGFDRINDYSSQKPLIKGLVRPYQAKQLSLFFLGASVLTGLYCFIEKPQILMFALIALFLGATVSVTNIRNYKGVSLVATFLLGGPLLVLGYEFLLYENLSLSSALLGAVFGYHALKYDFLKQVRDIFFSSKANVVTLSNFFGFEKSKMLYTSMSLAHLLMLGLFCYFSQSSEMILILLLAVFFEAYINSQLYRAHSFLSSQLSTCLSLQKFHFLVESSLIVFVFMSPIWKSLL